MRPKGLTITKTMAKVSVVTDTAGVKKSVARRSTGLDYSSAPHARVSIHGLELLEVLRISMPTPRGQEAQLDQVVEAHRIAREGRIDNASGKEEDDQDQFSSSGRPAAVRAEPVELAGWAVLGELAAGT